MSSPAAGRASTSGSTSSGRRGSRILLWAHGGACGAVRCPPAGAALGRRRAGRTWRQAARVQQVPAVAAAPRTTRIRPDHRHRCDGNGELARTERLARLFYTNTEPSQWLARPLVLRSTLKCRAA